MSSTLKEVMAAGSILLEAKFKPIIAPSEIVNRLDQYVVGQHKAKVALATTVCYHNLICEHNAAAKDSGKIELKKSNLVLIGSSGSGKTYLVETLGKILDRKVLVVDIANFTSSGYVGRDVDSIIKEALELCDDDQEEFENMIIFIDEIDKIAGGGDSSGVNSTKVQGQLLKLIEGQENKSVTDGHDRIRSGGAFVNTKNILWVFGGAFTPMLEEKKNNLDPNKKSMGFYDGNTNVDSKGIVVEQEDLVKYGLARELVGRMGQIELLDDLTRENFYQIMTQPVDSLVNQYKILGELARVNLSLTENEIWDIVDKAMTLKVGARALKSVCEEHLRERMFF